MSGDNWSTTAPAWQDGKYVWTKTVFHYSNGTSTETPAVCITGASGPTGPSTRVITLAGSGQVFQLPKGGSLTPNSITVTGVYQGISGISGWFYSTNGGVNFSTTVPAGFSRTNNAITITGASMTASSVVIKATENVDGTGVYDVFTVSKVADGTDGSSGNGILSTAIHYQKSASGTTPPSTWQTTIPAATEGEHIWTRTTISYTSSPDTVSYSVSKVGKDGIGIVSVVITYQEGTSATTAPGGTWTQEIPTV